MLKDASVGRQPETARQISRRSLFGKLLGYTVLLGASLPFITADMAKAQEKANKTTAKYQEQPKDGHSCSICQFFHPPKTCQLVDGDISPNGWCSFWAKKA